MKIAVLFLLCAAVGAAQTTKPPNCIGHDAKGNCTALEQASDDPKSGRIDRLSDDEYAELQKLRDAVAAKEKEIAKAHGVDFGNPGCVSTTNLVMCDSIYRPGDTYEYRGQYLLVNVPAPRLGER